MCRIIAFFLMQPQSPDVDTIYPLQILAEVSRSLDMNFSAFGTLGLKDIREAGSMAEQNMKLI